MVLEPQDATFIILDSRPGKERDQWMKVMKDLGVILFAILQSGDD